MFRLLRLITIGECLVKGFKKGLFMSEKEILSKYVVTIETELNFKEFSKFINKVMNYIDKLMPGTISNWEVETVESVEPR